MVPDKGFTKQLKKLDPEFDVVWDWYSEHWEIWKFPKGEEEYHVLTVEGKGKTYRELGTDVLLSLSHSIFWRDNFTADQIADYLDELDAQNQRRKAKDFMNTIESITNETFDYQRGVLKIQVPRAFKVGRMVQNA